MGGVAEYIMRGRRQAIMVASFLALLSLIPFLLPVSIVSSATIALVTLRRGASEGAYVLLSGCLAVAILGQLLLGSYLLTLSYGLFLWLPILIISILLREIRYLSLVIESVVVMVALAIIAAYLYEPNLGAIWKLRLTPLFEQLVAKSPQPIPKENIDIFLSFISPILTGLIAQTYAIMLLSGLFLGRFWQAKLYNPDGFKNEYLGIKSHKILAIITLIMTAVIWFFSETISEIYLNIFIVLFSLYAFIGTIILHCSFSTMKYKRFLVPFLYVTMILVPHAIIPTAIIGLADSWLDIRARISNQNNA